MQAGGYEAMLHDLLARDISAFNVRDVPTTEGLQRQRSLSLPTTEAWWKYCLERGYVFRSKLGLEDYFTQWHDRVSTELLFQSYIEFAKGRHERRPLSREHIGRFFTNTLKVEGGKWRNGVVGEHLVKEALGYTAHELLRGKQPAGYVVGTLAEAQKDFTTATGLDVVWEAIGELLEPDETPEDPPKRPPKY